MKTTNHFWQNLNSFSVAGINYRISDVSFRSRYSLQESQIITIYRKLHTLGIKEIFIISTCNRTEFYCHDSNIINVLGVWCNEVNGNISDLKKHIYYKQGEEAIKHIFKVGSGLDSQILGDYEISGQIKKAFTLAKNEGATKAFCDRLISTMQQISKRIRTETLITQGSVSTSHFAVNYIDDYLKKIPAANILLLGTGKIGLNTLKSLTEKIPAHQLCIINRTDNKAMELAEKFNIKCRPYELLDESVDIADIIIVATNAPLPIVLQKQFITDKKRLIIDLSIPSNVDEEAIKYASTTYLNVDELSKYTDETLSMRWKEVPEALHIIDEGIEQFIIWLKERSGYYKVEHIKNNMISFHKKNSSCKIKEQHIISRCNDFFVNEVKHQTYHGCKCIELVNELLEYSVA